MMLEIFIEFQGFFPSACECFHKGWTNENLMKGSNVEKEKISNMQRVIILNKIPKIRRIVFKHKEYSTYLS